MRYKLLKWLFWKLPALQIGNTKNMLFRYRIIEVKPGSIVQNCLFIGCKVIASSNCSFYQTKHLA